MSSQPLHHVSSALAHAGRFLHRQRAALAVVAVGSVVAGLVGYGLANSFAPLFQGRVAWVGAAVAAAVTLIAVPLALWARTPDLRPKRLSAVPASPPRASAAASASTFGTASPAPAAAATGGDAGRLFAAVAGVGAADAAVPTSAAAAGKRVAASNAGPAAAAVGAADAQRPVRDALTGAYTQQHFVAAADREWSRIRRHGEDAALLMIDIDRLKGVNERYSNACGDALLVEITRQVSTTLRQYDLLARFGGGVLVVYLPHTDPMGALDVAERVRERVAALRVSWDSHTLRSTVSVGVAAIGASHVALDEVIADAGNALRDAKAAGRNCVRAAPIPPRRSNHPFPNGAKRPAGPL